MVEIMRRDIRQFGETELKFTDGTKVQIKLADEGYIVTANDMLSEEQASTILNTMVNLVIKRMEIRHE